ncbi:hypothetical protein [Bacillus sp. FJAT-27251]|uniref:hypothetical protein n=1 Tax=Bacillus sp. FJAT-27251 TaxID=1684142 RepID=UPI000A6C61FB|nr:hypothetical protein [Bacillus sp. FJAT-27251]
MAKQIALITQASGGFGLPIGMEPAQSGFQVTAGFQNLSYKPLTNQARNILKKCDGEV